MFQSDHLVENAPQTPDIRLLVIRLLLTDLRREIIGRTDGRLGTIISMLEDPGNPEISNFDGPLLSHKDILSFQVSMKNLLVMNVLYSKRHLHKPVEDLVFAVANY